MVYFSCSNSISPFAFYYHINRLFKGIMMSLKNLFMNGKLHTLKIVMFLLFVKGGSFYLKSQYRCKKNMKVKLWDYLKK